MRVLLINPPLISSHLVSKQYPLNLAYLGAYLEEAGFGVHLLDLNVENIPAAGLRDLLIRVNPAVVGITAMTATVNAACAISRVIKKVSPGIKVIIGGPHVTALPEETLHACKDVDCIVFGEGEETFREICSNLRDGFSLEGIRGTVYRANGSVKRQAPRELISNLDSLPFPRRDYADILKYKMSHVSRGISRRYLNIAEMVLSRGCPGRCIFCAANLSWHNKIRFRSIPNIISEIEYCRSKLGATHFSFEDDSLSFNRQWLELLCRELTKCKVTWNCNLRVDMVTPGLLKLMAESGCIKVQFGVESGSQRILDLIQKDISIEQVERAVEWAHQAKMQMIEGSFILGAHPEERLEDVFSTLGLIKRLKINLLMLSLACPFPGTRLYELVKDGLSYRGRQWDDFIFYGNKPVLASRHIPDRRLVRLQRKAYLEFYLRPELILQMWRTTGSFAGKCYWIASGMNFLHNFLIPSSCRTKRNGII